MASDATEFSWRLPLYGALVALLILVPIDLSQTDTAFFLNMFAVAPVLLLLTVSLLIYAAIRRSRRALSLLATLAVVWTVSVSLTVSGQAIRNAGRWLIWSHEYKRQVLAQPASASGEFKHIEWDGWGFAGSDTVEYLVLDPADSLSTLTRSHSAGKLGGIPCEVSRVRRLESHYYRVLFYTETDWTHCN